MFKILKMIVYFLKELIFDKKDELDIKSSKFNTRKFSVLMIVLCSLILNVFCFIRIYSLAKHQIEYKEYVEKSCTKNNQNVPSDSKIIEYDLKLDTETSSP